VAKSKDNATMTGICGFALNEVGECPRCKLANIGLEREAQTPDVLDQVRDLLEGQDGGPAMPQ
jgi:hypothetical protein